MGRSKFFNKLAHVARWPAAFLLHTFGCCSIAAATCCCCCCNSAYLRVFARQCYTNGNFEAVCGCLPSAGRDFCYQPRPPHASRLRHSAPPVACRLHNEPQPNKVKFIKSTEEKPKRMPKSRKTNENEILSECKSARGVGGSGC